MSLADAFLSSWLRPPRRRAAVPAGQRWPKANGVHERRVYRIEPSTLGLLPNVVHRTLWRRLWARLEAGEPIYLPRHFDRVMAQEWQRLMDTPPGPRVRRILRESADRYNRQHPEVYVLHGLRNAVVNALEEGARRLGWDHHKVRRDGADAVREVLRIHRLRPVLDRLKVRPGEVNPVECAARVAGRLAWERWMNSAAKVDRGAVGGASRLRLASSNP